MSVEWEDCHKKTVSDSELVLGSLMEVGGKVQRYGLTYQLSEHIELPVLVQKVAFCLKNIACVPIDEPHALLDNTWLSLSSLNPFCFIEMAVDLLMAEAT